MNELLELYQKEYNAKEPIVCVDEKNKQLLKDKKKPIQGKVRKVDYQYERNGTQNIFLAVEPKAGKRSVQITDHRRKIDFAIFIKDFVERKYKRAKKIHVVLDNLNTHFEKSFYETFSKEEAGRILSRLQFHYTPKHGSWLNMAEIEISIMSRQCLNRRIGTREFLRTELRAWERKRNKDKMKITWKFTRQDADKKLGKHYT